MCLGSPAIPPQLPFCNLPPPPRSIGQTNLSVFSLPFQTFITYNTFVMANTEVDLDEDSGLSQETYLNELLERGPSVDSLL